MKKYLIYVIIKVYLKHIILTEYLKELEYLLDFVDAYLLNEFVYHLFNSNIEKLKVKFIELYLMANLVLKMDSNVKIQNKSSYSVDGKYK